MIKHNIDKVRRNLKEKINKVPEALSIGMREGLRQYESFVVKDMLSGRKSSGYGLNRRSGTAANSLDVKVLRSPGEIVGTLSVARRAWYLRVHQHDGFDGHIRAKNAAALHFQIKKGKWVTKKQVFIPKRLYIYERFKRVGVKMIRNRITNRLERL